MRSCSLHTELNKLTWHYDSATPQHRSTLDPIDHGLHQCVTSFVRIRHTCTYGKEIIVLSFVFSWTKLHSITMTLNNYRALHSGVQFHTPLCYREYSSHALLNDWVYMWQFFWANPAQFRHRRRRRHSVAAFFFFLFLELEGFLELASWGFSCS